MPNKKTSKAKFKMTLQEYIAILDKPKYITTRKQIIEYLNRAYKQGRKEEREAIFGKGGPSDLVKSWEGHIRHEVNAKDCGGYGCVCCIHSFFMRLKKQKLKEVKNAE